jgi:hypothetical protein
MPENSGTCPAEKLWQLLGHLLGQHLPGGTCPARRGSG